MKRMLEIHHAQFLELVGFVRDNEQVIHSGLNIAVPKNHIIRVEIKRRYTPRKATND